MNRVLVMWRTPQVLGPEEGRAWCMSEVERIRAAGASQELQLSRLTAPSEDEPAWYGWLLELRVDGGRVAAEVLKEPTLASFLADLRSLRCHPVTVATAD